MKTQITNHNNDTITSQRGNNSSAWRSLAITVLLLLATVSYAGAQVKYNSCFASPIGGNGCPSPQYRSGAIGSVYNADLTGAPWGGGAKGVLNSTSVSQLALLTPSQGIQTHGGCQAQPSGTAILSPTSSPSIESRIVFPALDMYSNCALFYYDVTNPTAPQYMPPISTLPVTSSPGYNGEVVIAGEDGSVYSYDWASNTLAWTFTNPYAAPFDSSPSTWPGLPYTYVVDALGDIFYLNDSGSAAFTIFSPVFPGGVNPTYPGGYTPSASSLAASTASNKLFVAGGDGSGAGAVCAYDAKDSTFLWCNKTPINVVTSSPVVSDSLGGLYVQSSATCSTPLIYALDFTGKVLGSAQPFYPNGSCNPARGEVYLFSSGGSPAYDGTANGGASKYVIASAYVAGYSYLGHGTPPTFQFSVLDVFDATNGAQLCSAAINHPITNSSPEVVNGVIYIGTDDGYVLAYQEPPTCNNGALNLLWTSSTGSSCVSGSPCPMDKGLEGPPVVSFNRVHAVSQNGTLYV